MAESLIKGVHHMAVKCASLEEYEKELHFYCEVLGLKITREWGAGVMISAGDTRIELFKSGGDAGRDGLVKHFAFATDDVDGCAKAVKEAGYEVFMEPKDISFAPDGSDPARIAFCYGPLGEEVEFFREG